MAIGMNPLPAIKLLATLESFFLLDPRWTSPLEKSSRNRGQGRDQRLNPIDDSAMSNRRIDRFSINAVDPRGIEDGPTDELPNRPLHPITVFLYSDFLKLYPDLVLKWSKSFAIGSRGWSILN